MEKISIVQRRRRNNEIQTAALARAERREQMKKDVHKYLDAIQEKVDVISLGESQGNENADNFIVTLSPDQAKELNSLFDYSELMKGSAEEANVRIYRNENNQVVFRFMLQPQKSLQMLTSEDVCNMLKISRRTLYKNVHNNEIASYKIGSQLRFLAEDIMEYFKKSKQN